MPGKRVASEDYVKNAIRNLTIKLAGARMSSGGVAGPHDLLSSVHSDVVASEPVRGDIICANSTPAWTRLPIGAAGEYVRSDGADVEWSELLSADINWGVVTGLAYLTAGALSQKTLGIANTNIPPIDMAGVADNDYAKFTASGLEGRSYSEVLVDLSGQAGAAFDWNSRDLTSVANIVINNGGTIGQAAGPLLTFDDTNNALELTGSILDIDAGAVGTPVVILRSNGPSFMLHEKDISFYGAFTLNSKSFLLQEWSDETTWSKNVIDFSLDAPAGSLVMLNNGNFGISQTTFGTWATKTLALGTGTAPDSSPADCFQMFSKDVNAVAGKAGAHIRNENTGVLIVPGVLIKTDTGSPAYNFEGMICINTFDNTVDMYADAGWRTLASW